MECVYDVGVQDDHVPIVSMFFFLGSAARSLYVGTMFAGRCPGREEYMGYINGGGGWFWRWEGTTRVMGSVCVCVCVCVLGCCAGDGQIRKGTRK